MSIETCPTVQIKADNEQGFIIINESDFDATTQVLFDTEEKEPVKAETKAVKEPKGFTPA